jgi:hypothetical protein
VVEPGAAPIEEACETLVARGSDELDGALACAQHGGFGLLVGHQLSMSELEPEELLVGRERRIEIADDYRHVVELLDAQHA